MENQEKNGAPSKVVEYRRDEDGLMRFAISDSDGNIVDDAQGYGYKSRRNAEKALWYKKNRGAIKKRASDARRTVSEHSEVIKDHEWILSDFHFVKEGMSEKEISDMFWKRVCDDDPDFAKSLDAKQKRDIERQLLDRQ